MASNDFKNSLKLLLTNIKDKHYTKKETELKLEEIKAIRDVEELPTENANENVLYRVEENSWSGTVVPNTGYVENLYFNINSSCDEVTNILKSLQFVETPFTSDPVYPIVLFSDGICFFVVDESDGLYAIYATTDITDPSLANVIFSNFEFDNKIGWHYSTDYIGINTSAVNEYSGLSIGTQNDKLSSLFSITPFVQATGKPQLYHFKNSVPYKVGLTKEDVIDILNEQFENAEEGAY